MSPQTVVCDECRVNVGTHIISFLDGSRVPLALCQEHLIRWMLTYLMDTLPDEALFQVAAALMPDVPAAQEPEAEPTPPKRRGRRAEREQRDADRIASETATHTLAIVGQDDPDFPTPEGVEEPPATADDG